MSVVDAIKLNYTDNSGFTPECLNQLRNFLENCHLNNSFGADFKELLTEISLFEEKPISYVEGKFREVIQYCVDLIELNQQLYSQQYQLAAIIKSFPPEEIEFLEIKDLDSEIFKAHYTGYVDSILF